MALMDVNKVNQPPSGDTGEENVAILLAPAPVPLPETSGSDVPNWEEFNRSVRAKVKAWILHDGPSCLPFLRAAMAPALRMMFKFLKMSGEEWDVAQEDSLLTSGARKYRVTSFHWQNVSFLLGKRVVLRRQAASSKYVSKDVSVQNNQESRTRIDRIKSRI